MSYTPNATAGDDILTGDAQPDVIDALEGDDIVFGGGGDDELLGGPGNDRLYGEAGNDRLLGGTGDDRYQVDRTDTVTEQVDEGTDSIYFRDDSFTGIYFLAANVENLTMIGRFNNLSAFGNSLDNRIYGNNTGNDTLLGGAGHDYIQGDFAYLNGSNSFSSDTGEDLLRGGAGDDVIWGDQGEGKELIHSLANDRLYGDNGDDILYGQAGADVLDGGWATTPCTVVPEAMCWTAASTCWRPARRRISLAATTFRAMTCWRAVRVMMSTCLAAVPDQTGCWRPPRLVKPTSCALRTASSLLTWRSATKGTTSISTSWDLPITSCRWWTTSAHPRGR